MPANFVTFTLKPVSSKPSLSAADCVLSPRSKCPPGIDQYPAAGLNFLLTYNNELLRISKTPTPINGTIG